MGTLPLVQKGQTLASGKLCQAHIEQVTYKLLKYSIVITTISCGMNIIITVGFKRYHH